MARELDVHQLSAGMAWELLRAEFLASCRRDEQAAEAATRAEGYRLRLLQVEGQLK